LRVEVAVAAAFPAEPWNWVALDPQPTLMASSVREGEGFGSVSAESEKEKEEDSFTFAKFLASKGGIVEDLKVLGHLKKFIVT
jgi:hypothetical protein